jgi:hypothetical protein
MTYEGDGFLMKGWTRFTGYFDAAMSLFTTIMSACIAFCFIPASVLCLTLTVHVKGDGIRWKIACLLLTTRPWGEGLKFSIAESLLTNQCVILKTPVGVA